MPSSSLVIISGQIEEQGSDSFTKFYMYSSLLHAICVRDPSKGFFDLMPAKVNVLFGTSTGFDLEKFDGAFETQVNQYRGMFSPAQPAPLVVVEKIVMTYLRKSQVADLVFIIDKMLDHLSDPNFKPTKKIARASITTLVLNLIEPLLKTSSIKLRRLTIWHLHSWIIPLTALLPQGLS